MRRRWGTGGLILLAAGGAVAGAGPVLGAAGAALLYGLMPVVPALLDDPTTVRLSDGRLKGLLRGKARHCLVVPSETSPGWAIRIPEPRWDPVHTAMPPVQVLVEFTGDDARIVASRMIPAANRFGAGARTVQDAVGLVERGGGADAAVLALTAETPRIGSLHRSQRLALEMALHEETERRALEGELAALEAQWRAAEELAAISDSLLVPEEVERKLERMKRRGRPSGEAG